MNESDFGGILGQLGSSPGGAAPLRGRKPVDRSFYTYGKPRQPPQGKMPGGPLPMPAPGSVRAANFASGGAPMLPQHAPGPLLGAPDATAPGYGQGILHALGGVSGAGTGRSDEIDAKLSDGEYVLDAETVSLLGDGSTEAGIKRLDEMRENLRSHKGKALAKGKFSPNAKAPEAYLGSE